MSWKRHIARKPEPGGLLVTLCQEQGGPPVLKNPVAVRLETDQASPLDVPNLCKACREKAAAGESEMWWEYALAEGQTEFV